MLIYLRLADEVIEVDKSNAPSWREMIHKLRARRWNFIISPHQSPRTSMLVRSLNAERKIGYSGWLRNLIFTSRLNRSMDLPEALRQLELLVPLDHGVVARGLQEFRAQQDAEGGQTSSGELSPVPDWSAMEVPRLHQMRLSFLSGSDSEFTPRVRELLTQYHLIPGKIAILAPGSVWPTKMWTAKGFAGVGERLHSMGYQILLIGAPSEAEVCRVIQRQAGCDVIVLAGQITLVETLELLTASSLLISNDSGAMHMAALANIPTVSIFGPTVLELGYRPWQNFGTVVQIARAELKCRPCGKHGSRRCPIGTHECMERISGEQVVAEALRVLACAKG